MTPLALLAALGVVALLYMKRNERIGFRDGMPFVLEVADVGNGATLEKTAAAAFLRMKQAAAGYGIALEPTGSKSGFRTAAMQAELLASKGPYGTTNADGTPGLAAPIGRSPHQAGYALDISGLDPARDNFSGARSEWLKKHGPSYGWFPVGDSYVTTVEPWHWEFRPIVKES